MALAGGGAIVERLESVDEKERTYSYAILQGPLPVANYVATLKVREAEEGEGCEVEWSSEFSPAGAPETDVIHTIEGIYQAGLDSLKKMFGG